MNYIYLSVYTQSNTLFLRQRCEVPSIANCENKPIKPTCQTSDKPFVPHETNCSKFYVCIPNEKYELNCRENWIFDYKLQVCMMI